MTTRPVSDYANTPCKYCLTPVTHLALLRAEDVCNCLTAKAMRYKTPAEIASLPHAPMACPSSLCDLDAVEQPMEVPPKQQVTYKCPACARPNFVIVSGVVICAACGSGTGMSVVSTNVVQELRTERDSLIKWIINIFEALLPLMDDLSTSMPLMAPQLKHLSAVIKARLLELKL